MFAFLKRLFGFGARPGQKLAREMSVIGGKNVEVVKNIDSGGGAWKRVNINQPSAFHAGQGRFYENEVGMFNDYKYPN